ncbi:7207_t:CDS:1, partial [Cetraspora pellucida]
SKIILLSPVSLQPIGRENPENGLNYIQFLVDGLSHNERKELSTYLHR